MMINGHDDAARRIVLSADSTPQGKCGTMVRIRIAEPPCATHRVARHAPIESE